MTSHLRKELIREVETLFPWLIKVRRDFHQYPELGLQEERTMRQIVRYLQEMGIEVEEGIAGTGVVGLIRGKEEGKTVALRADMDALPITEENEVAYRSRIEGNMHACGHDAHMTIQLGAAHLLQKLRHRLKGNVKLIFQPAEETVGGAKPMIEAGVLENPQVEAIFGLHMAPDIPVGQIALKYGQMNAASDTLKLTIIGEEAHGAYPHLGKDAILMAAQVIVSLQSIVSRNLDPRESACISIGVIKGGTQGNILAREVELTGTIRTLNPQVRKQVLTRVEAVVRHVTQAFDGSYHLQWEAGYAPLINDSELVDLVRKNAAKLLAEERIIIDTLPSLGVEDFAFFAEQVPAAFYRLGCRNEAKGIVYPLHHPRFDLDEECLKIGTLLQVENVLTFLGDVI